MKFGVEAISAVAGFVLSFLVEKVPGFNAWWDTFQYKALAMAGFGAAIIAALVGLAYAGAPIEGVPVPFIWDGLWVALSAWIAFIAANQAAYLMQSVKR